MKTIMEKLWNEYLFGECSIMDTEEERALAKAVVEKQKKINERLTREQSDAMDAYMDAVYALQGCFVKKVFFKGCAFAASLLFAFGMMEKE